jgi:hypothetical protein
MPVTDVRGGNQPFAALPRHLLVIAEAVISLHAEPCGSEKAIAG